MKAARHSLLLSNPSVSQIYQRYRCKMGAKLVARKKKDLFLFDCYVNLLHGRVVRHQKYGHRIWETVMQFGKEKKKAVELFYIKQNLISCNS